MRFLQLFSGSYDRGADISTEKVSPTELATRAFFSRFKHIHLKRRFKRRGLNGTTL